MPEHGGAQLVSEAGMSSWRQNQSSVQGRERMNTFNEKTAERSAAGNELLGPVSPVSVKKGSVNPTNDELS